MRITLELVKTRTLGPILRVQEVWWLARECAFLTSSQVILMLLGVLEDPLATSPVNCSDTNLMVSFLISKLQLTLGTWPQIILHFVLLSWKCFILISLILFLCLFADFSHLINRTHLQLHVYFLRELLRFHCLGRLIYTYRRLSNKHPLISKVLSSGWWDMPLLLDTMMFKTELLSLTLSGQWANASQISDNCCHEFL